MIEFQEKSYNKFRAKIISENEERYLVELKTTYSKTVSNYKPGDKLYVLKKNVIHMKKVDAAIKETNG